MISLNYPDTVTLVKTRRASSGYATEVVDSQANVQGMFMQVTGYGHGTNRDEVTSTATCYLDPTDPFLIANDYRLEGMLLNSAGYGIEVNKAWYRITDVNVGQDKLLNSDVDNIECTLKKTSPVVSYVS